MFLLIVQGFVRSSRGFSDSYLQRCDIMGLVGVLVNLRVLFDLLCGALEAFGEL